MSKLLHGFIGSSLNVLYLIALSGIALLLAYSLSPLHEAFHEIPCKAAGIYPEVSYFGVNCPGIFEKSDLIQFFYFMGPYLFYFFTLLIGYLYEKKSKFIKYLLLIPIFDVLYNYFSTLNASDFSFLLKNTLPNKVPFIIAMLIVLCIAAFTCFLIFKMKLWSYDTFKSDLKYLFYKNK